MTTTVYRDGRVSVPGAENQTILKSIAHIGEDFQLAVTDAIKKNQLRCPVCKSESWSCVSPMNIWNSSCVV